jgi:hypothetical protein
LQKGDGGLAQGVGPEFKSQYHTHTHKKKKRKKERKRNCVRHEIVVWGSRVAQVVRAPA